MASIELASLESVTAVARLERRSAWRYGAHYDVQLGALAILGVSVTHEPPFGPAVYFPAGITCDAEIIALVERAVLMDYLGIEEDPSEPSDATERARPIRYST